MAALVGQPSAAAVWRRVAAPRPPLHTRRARPPMPPPAASRGVAGRPRMATAPRRRPTAARAAAPASSLAFTKYQGLGNDFILIDNMASSEPLLTPDQAAALCDRHTGVGGDGVIFALPPPAGGGADYTMRIYNSDGSEPEMCGNGIRCLARFARDAGLVEPALATHAVATGAGLIKPTLLDDGTVRVDMGRPILEAVKVPTTLAPTRGATAVQAPLAVAGATWLMTCVSMGNPHAVTFGVAGGGDAGVDLGALDLMALGPQFESHPAFPARTNTEFVQILSRSHVRMAVWERGAGATLACGTGACATLVAGVLEGRLDRAARVDLPGGPLHIEWEDGEGVEGGTIFMTGPATRVFAGVA